ncbi:hypothetical protein B7Y94_06150 [Candidatus Saccharibacteria bacterium 32-49-12]|nr:MAG: hypothetical protein B7Y94_06150 [Candidatus Saccharibacteria bacterium 32-49-12]
MSIFNFLELQPVEPSNDGSVSELDQYDPDETIDLSRDIDENMLESSWDEVLMDLENDPDKLTFTTE